MTSPFNSRTTKTVDDWETPPDFFKLIDDIFHFTLDPCATAQNKKCQKFYTEQEDGLNKDWQGERVFCNPPYNAIELWTEKCYNEGEKEHTLVALLTKPATETKRWIKFIMKAKTVWFISPRINFLKNGVKPTKNGSNFPSILVIFEKHEERTEYKALVWKNKL